MSDSAERNLPMVPWTMGDIVKAVVLLIIGVIALNVPILIFLVVQVFVDGLSDVAQMMRSPLLIGIAVIAGEVVFFLAAWAFSVRKYGGDWKLLGFRAYDATRTFFLVLLVVVLCEAVTVAYGLLINALGRQDLLPHQPVLEQLGRGPLGIALLFLAASVAAPLAEETFFRGFLFAGVARRVGPILAAIISAAAFASAHFEIGALAPIFALGLALTWLYYYTRSLWPSIIVHASYNTLAIVATLVSQQSSMGG